MKPDPEKPYNNLPHLPPGVDLKDQRLLLAALEAGEAIAELKTMLICFPLSLFRRQYQVRVSKILLRQITVFI
jgi:hypothetical protein